MSILIEGMAMPENGFITVTVTSDGRVVGNSRKKNGKFEYLNNEDVATAIPVPPHGRLGDGYDGLKVKYIVFKASNGKLVDDCFVLRPDKDNAAVAALAAYADTTENQVLAADIRKWLSTIIPAEEGE